MKHVTLLVLTLLLLSVPTTAVAQRSASDVANADTDRLFTEGIAAFEAERYEEAWVAFKKAYALNPTLFIRYNLAFAALKAGHHLEAARLLEEVVPCDMKCPQELKKYGGTLLEQANEHLGRLQIRSVSEGARVEVDGEPIPPWTASKSWHVEPGVHEIKSYAGNGPDTRRVSVTAGQVVTVEFEPADPERVPPLEPTSTQDEGEATPLSPSQPGEAPGKSNSRTTAVITGGVLTGAVLTGAIISTVSAANLRGDAEDMRRALSNDATTCGSAAAPADCDALSDTVDRAERRQTLANRLFLASGVLAVATAAAWWWWPDQKEGTSSAQQKLVPILGSDGAGIELSGQF